MYNVSGYVIVLHTLYYKVSIDSKHVSPPYVCGTSAREGEEKGQTTANYSLSTLALKQSLSARALNHLVHHGLCFRVFMVRCSRKSFKQVEQETFTKRNPI